MRHMYRLGLIISSVLFLLGCNEKKQSVEPYRPDSSGPINVVSVFSTPEIYQELEAQLNDTLLFGRVFPGLYYPPEVIFATRPFDSRVFDNFNKTRLILKLNQGSPSIKIEKNTFSKPQGFVEVSANTPKEIIDLLYQNQDSIINLYRWADRNFLLSSFRDKKKHTPEIKELGVDMLIPSDYKLVETQENFVWYRKDEVNTVHNRDANNNLVNRSSNDILNILIYKIKYTKPELDLEDLIKIRDSVTSKYMHGQKEPQYQYFGKDSTKLLISDYVQTEQNPILRDFYDFSKIKSHHKDEKVYESQGWWSMSLSQMGGPYTVKTILNTKKKTLYIADAILFAPLNQGKSKKRDYITQIEGLFTTFKTNK